MQIIVRQLSGLGNQLFQYAAGRYFSSRHNAQLTLAVDPRGAVSHGYPRPFLLSHFAIRANVRSLTALDRLHLSPRTAARSMSLMLGAQVVSVDFSQRYRFRSDLALRPNVRALYLNGYWQAFGYADAIAGELRAELALREPPAGKNLELLQRIRNTDQPISVHIRRGDYALSAEGNIALGSDYYRGAIRIMQQRVPSATFFVFSDEMEFAKAVLPPEVRAEFVNHNDDFSAHEDLRLMAACRHHIIANSTFSWWGAWLNAAEDKIVVAPKYWLLTEDSYFPELLPPGWNLVDNRSGNLANA